MYTTLKKVFGLLGLIICSTSVFAQDLHFSQFFANPLTLNPANSGLFVEDWRVSAIQRQQWNQINAGFNTTSIGADMNFKGGVLNQDVVGVSVNVYQDNMASVIANQTLSLAGAYHHYLDGAKRHRVSAGIQGTYSQKKYDSEGWQFADQFDPYRYNPDKGSAESLDLNTIPNLNLNVGAIYAFRIKNNDHISLGFSSYQLGSPKESLINSGNELSVRFSLELSGNFALSPRVEIRPHILYMNQSRAKDFTPEFELKYSINNELSIFAGTWYRTQDAFILLCGLGYKKVELRFSYDQTTSGLKRITEAANVNSNVRVSAWEVSIVLKGILNRAVAGEFTVPCGIF